MNGNDVLIQIRKIKTNAPEKVTSIRNHKFLSLYGSYVQYNMTKSERKTDFEFIIMNAR